MNKKKVFIIVTVIILICFLLNILPYILFPGSVGGHLGLRPQSHQCMGISLKADTTKKFFPKGDVKIPLIITTFVYRVDNWGREYCLGKDVWYGE